MTASCENDLFTRLKENISEKDLTKIREYMTSCEREREWEELVWFKLSKIVLQHTQYIDTDIILRNKSKW